MAYDQESGIPLTNGSTSQASFNAPVARNLPPMRGFDVFEICASVNNGASTDSNSYWIETNAIATGLYSYGYNNIQIEQGWWFRQGPNHRTRCLRHKLPSHWYSCMAKWGE